MTAPAELELYRPEAHVWWSSYDASKVACAVCIPHGARLRLRDIPQRLQQQLGVGAEEEVVFIQMSAEVGRHRDGVRFTNGQEILLQRLAEGQHARVVSLLSSASAEEPADEVVAESNGVALRACRPAILSLSGQLSPWLTKALVFSTQRKLFSEAARR